MSAAPAATRMPSPSRCSCAATESGGPRRIRAGTASDPATASIGMTKMKRPISIAKA